MKAIPDQRPQALEELDRILDARAGLPVLRVRVSGDNDTDRYFVLRNDELRAAKREEIRRYLMRHGWRARIDLFEGALKARPDDGLDWPGPPMLPFAEPDEEVQSVPVRQIIVARVQVQEEFTPDEDEPGCPPRPERPPRDAFEARARQLGWHSRSSVQCAYDVLAFFARDEVEYRLTGQQIEDALAGAMGSKKPASSVISYTLTDMAKTGWLTNSKQKDALGLGYYPTELGRRILEERMIEMED